MAHDLERTGPIRRLPMLALLSANAVSMTGNAIANIGIPWFVLETTGSAAKVGLASAVLALSNVLAAFFGGPVVDRLGYKRLSVLADVLSGAAVALVPLLYSTVGLAFWQLLVLVFLGGVSSTHRGLPPARACSRASRTGRGCRRRGPTRPSSRFCRSPTFSACWWVGFSWP